LDSEEDLRKKFREELEGFTASTIRDLESLLRDLRVVQEKGFATDMEEFEEGLRCIAAPIRDYTRKVIGALSISGPANRLTDEKIESHYGPEVVRSATDLSARLGFRE
jgi:IclR family KDG regulon transcriptional repressor